MQVRYRNFVFYRLLFFIKFGGNIFVFLSFNLASVSMCIVPSHVIAESSTILA